MLDASKLFEAVGGTEPKETDAGPEPGFDVPIQLTDLDKWANYMNDDLYELDKKVREFIKKTRYQRRKKGGYRTTAPVVFAWIYGRQPEPSDGALCRMLHELLRYYCTSYTGRTTYRGKSVPRVYEFSRNAGDNRLPYSLRLRLEEMGEDANLSFYNADSEAKRRVGRRKHSGDGVEKDG